MKNKRKIISFEPEKDLELMLHDAQQSGLLLADIMNQSLRECGPKVISNLAKSKIEKLAKFTTKRSFNSAEPQAVGLAA